MAKLELHDGIPQAVSPSNAVTHLRDKTGFYNRGDHEPHAVRHFPGPAVVIDLFIYVLGLILICPAAWHQVSHLGSYRALLRVAKNSRVVMAFRGVCEGPEEPSGALLRRHHIRRRVLQ